MAADVAVQETIIPVAVVVVMVFSAAITTIAVTGLSGLSCFPASVAETIMDAASFQYSGRCKNRPF